VHNTWLSSSNVNPKLIQHFEPKSDCLLSQLWIDAYSKESNADISQEAQEGLMLLGILPWFIDYFFASSKDLQNMAFRVSDR